MEILIVIGLIIVVYITLKSFTVHRCPHCQSRYIQRVKNEETKPGYERYVCSACGKYTERKKLFYRNK